MFLNLRNRIETDLGADFLLIDSRTGITDIGTAAVAFMPNVTVCLFLCNTESLAGTLLMLKTIHDVDKKLERSLEKSIETLPVLTRVLDKTQDENVAINLAQKQLKDFLNNKPLLILREHLSLHVSEELLLGSKKALLDSTLLRDYFLLFYALDKETAEKSKYNEFRSILEKDRHIATTSLKNPSQIDVLQSIKSRDEKKLFYAGKYRGNAPPTLPDQEENNKTYNKTYNKIEKEHQYGYSEGKQYGKFASQVLKILLNQIHQCEPAILPYEKPIEEKEINWDLMGLQIGTKLDFCSELYYLTKYRGLFLDIVQLGWVETFTCFLRKGSTVHEAIIGSNHQKKIQNAVAAAKKALEKNGHNNILEVCLMGESAAADVAARSISPIVSGHSLMFRRDAFGLQEWISEDNGKYSDNRMVVCDHSVAIKMKNLCGQSQYVFSENSDSTEKLVFSVGENDSIPTGFLYPIGDSNWRYMINSAVADVILKTPKIWGNSENTQGVYYDLKKSGIIPFTLDELISHLVMGMNPDDASKWLENYKTGRS